MQRLKIEILYISLHNLLKRRHGINRPLTRKDFFCDLGKHFLIPRNLRDAVMKEMENMGLIIKTTRNEIEILPCEFDLEKDANKLCQMLGVF